MRNLIIIILFSHFVPNLINAQSVGGNHIPNQKWRILYSPSTNVIYPKGMEPYAQRIANITNYINQNNLRSIGSKAGKINIVLQNQTVIPNGYVALAPIRSEFYATPPYSNNLLGSIDWLDILATHEYRHVLQNYNSRRGITKVASYVMGQSGWSMLSNLSVPNWYSEGDAVIAETAWSLNGRGRSAFFTQEQRALANKGIKYGYQKSRNGSFKSLVPDHYRLGYLMLTKARELKGNDVTATVLRQASKYKGVVYPFSQALKRNVGYGSTKLYNLAWKENKEAWADQLKSTELIKTENVVKRKPRVVTTYAGPKVLTDGSIIVAKGTYKETEKIVRIKNGKEKELTTMGIGMDTYISVGNNETLVAWTEQTKNARRSNQDFTDIIIYNLKSDKKTRLTSKTRYFSPTISPIENKVAAIYISPTLHTQIHILDAATGKVLKSIDQEKGYSLTRLAWTEDGKNIISIAKKDSKLALIKFSIDEKGSTELTGWTRHTMDAPVVRNNKVYYSAAYTGIENIYSVGLDGEGRITKVSSVPVAALEPTVSKDGREIYFLEQTENGNKLSKQLLNTINEAEFKVIEPFEMPFYKTIADKSEGGNIFEKIPTQKYNSQPYNGLFRGLRLHSWMFTPTLSTLNMNIMAQNYLEDIGFGVGGAINFNEKNANTFNAEMTIARYFPIFTFGAERAQRNTDMYSSNNTMIKSRFDETNLYGKVHVPLSWWKGNFRSSFVPSFTLSQRNLSNIKIGEIAQDANQSLLTSRFDVTYSTLRQRAYQNISSRLGIVLNYSAVGSMTGKRANRTTFLGKVYLPGLGKNHALKFTSGYQNEPLQNGYQFSDAFEYARGYEAPINDTYNKFSVDYTFPLGYPDMGLLGMTYFKRVRANVFYDHGTAQNVMLKTKTMQRSTGFELVFDNTVLNVIPASFGIRTSILLNNPDPDPVAKFGFFMDVPF
jgi:hypothetical protein